jgi:hypothetical protein
MTHPSIPAIPLVAAPETPEARAALGFRWAPDGVGRRHQLGGTPAWLGADETPLCTGCGTPMTFYAQLDSIGDNICLVDCGMIFVFVCFDCFSTRTVLQSG